MSITDREYKAMMISLVRGLIDDVRMFDAAAEALRGVPVPWEYDGNGCVYGGDGMKVGEFTNPAHARCAVECVNAVRRLGEVGS